MSLPCKRDAHKKHSFLLSSPSSCSFCVGLIESIRDGGGKLICLNCCWGGGRSHLQAKRNGQKVKVQAKCNRSNQPYDPTHPSDRKVEPAASTSASARQLKVPATLSTTSPNAFLELLLVLRHVRENSRAVAAGLPTRSMGPALLTRSGTSPRGPLGTPSPSSANSKTLFWRLGQLEIEPMTISPWLNFIDM